MNIISNPNSYLAPPAGGGSVSTSESSSGPDPASMARYQGEYNTALNLNQSNYNNILAGYQQVIQAQIQAQQGIQQGYGDLSSSVLGDIQAKALAQPVDARETLAHMARIEMRQIQVHIGVLRTLHAAEDGL